MTAQRIHVLGASGSGTSTLGRALAAARGHRHLDADAFYWQPTDPPYREPRPVSERLALLRAQLEASPSWVLSGSLVSWADELIPRFELVVFLEAPTEIRIRRLRQREIARFGHDALAPGGRMHEAHEAFLAWAAGYETGVQQGRSRERHEAWLALLPCRVLRLDGGRPVEELVRDVEDAARRPGRERA